MILYFSGTGNSLYVAKKMLKYMPDEKLIDIAVLHKNKECELELEAGEKVGFVFPVYFYGIPSIVLEFIERMQIKSSQFPYIYAVITCGASIGNAGKMLYDAMFERDCSLSSVYTVMMPDNYILLYNSPGKDKIEKILEQADTTILSVVLDIKKEKVDEKSLSQSVFSGLVTAVLYPFYKYGRKTKKFRVEETCIGCGLCEQMCPVHAISVKSGQPVWTQKECVHCLACIQRCPMEAIQYGNGTKSRTRYINPILHRYTEHEYNKSE